MPGYVSTRPLKLLKKLVVIIRNMDIEGAYGVAVTEAHMLAMQNWECLIIAEENRAAGAERRGVSLHERISLENGQTKLFTEVQRVRKSWILRFSQTSILSTFSSPLASSILLRSLRLSDAKLRRVQ